MRLDKSSISVQRRSIVHRAVSCHCKGKGTVCVCTLHHIDVDDDDERRLKTSCSTSASRTLVGELNFIGASSHTTSASSSSPLRKADSGWMDVHRLASLFLSSYSSCCSTHLHIFATHRFGLFTFACGFTIFSSSSLPHLTFLFLLLLFPIIDEKWFSLRFGTRFVCVETEH